jgi:hypothetical protein
MSDTTPAAVSARPAVRQLDEDELKELMEPKGRGGPRISIYMPTHRKGSETRENSIRFKALLKQAREEIGHGDGADKANAEARLTELDKLSDDNAFWQHQLDGLAVFSGPGTANDLGDRLRMYRIGKPLPERVAVADSFHLKPLIRVLQSAGRYHLLAVTQKSVRLFEGNLNSLDEVPLDDQVPTTVVEALGGQVDGDLNVNSYGGLSYSGMFHGHNDNKDTRDKDIERYLRAVDRAVYDYHGRGSNLPLYFAGDVDYHDVFFKVSHHPRLTKKGIRINPDAVEVDNERLRSEMEEVFRPDYDAEIHELTEQFGNAKAKGEGSDDVQKVAEAAFQGRVLTLLVDADKTIGGTIDPETGQARMLKESNPDVDDVLDDLCELSLKTGAKVRVIPSDQFPTETGVAAVYRYKQ